MADPNRYKKEWGFEAKRRIAEFQESWDQIGPKMLRFVTEAFGKDFPRTEYTVALSACAVSPSMPEPLLLNVTRYLSSYTSPKPARDLVSFPDLPIHELLHIWIDENFGEPTALKKKYQNEKPGVVGHVYLFAVQSFTYENLGNSKLWKEVRIRMLEFGGIHARAIEILEKEGRTELLSELYKPIK